MPYLPHKTCCPDPVASTAAWLHQSHHCELVRLPGRWRNNQDSASPRFDLPNRNLTETQFPVFDLLANQSQRNFAHATTALLSWHEQNVVVIESPKFEYRKNQYLLSNLFIKKSIFEYTFLLNTWWTQNGFKPTYREHETFLNKRKHQFAGLRLVHSPFEVLLYTFSHGDWFALFSSILDLCR